MDDQNSKYLTSSADLMEATDVQEVSLLLFNWVNHVLEVIDDSLSLIEEPVDGPAVGVTKFNVHWILFLSVLRFSLTGTATLCDYFYYY